MRVNWKLAGSGFRIEGSKVQRSEVQWFQVSVFRFQGSEVLGSGVQGFWVLVAGAGVQGSRLHIGFRCQMTEDRGQMSRFSSLR
jgi:hypothetical protein